MNKVIVLLLLIIWGASGDDFLSQSEIDQKIQRAYYRFIAAERQAGGEYSQREAIDKAKSTVQRLRDIAETDPNARYIMWRVSELEAQIALEEEEYHTVNAYKRGKQINEIVDDFNRELEKEFPSFGRLHGLHASMLAVDVRHANELADLVNQHQSYMRKKVSRDISRAFSRSAYDQAEELYQYAVQNRRYLGASPQDYNEWGSRINDHRTAQYLRENLDDRLSEVSREVDRSQDITYSRRTIEIFKADIENTASLLDRSFVNRYMQRLENMLNDIDRVEDSLVNYNLSLIKEGDIRRAARYYHNHLQDAGISHSKLAMVDRQLLNSAERELDAETSRAVAQQMKGMENTNTAGLLSVSDIQSRLRTGRDSLSQFFSIVEERSFEHYRRKNRRQARSIERDRRRHQRNTENAADKLADIKRFLNRGWYRTARRRYHRHKEDLFEYGDLEELYYVRLEINEHFDNRNDPDLQHLSSLRKKRSDSAQSETAADIIGEIYTHIEQRRLMSALETYYREKDFLQQYAHEDAFSSLRMYLLRRCNSEYDLYDG
ncbi:MAG: hypothetical protein ACQEQ4_01175 [Fibrobacterota bacterium]